MWSHIVVAHTRLSHSIVVTLHKNSNQSRIALQPLAVQQSLGHWGQNRYDFQWCEDPIPRASFCIENISRMHFASESVGLATAGWLLPTAGCNGNNNAWRQAT
jgi:hypothetical protein